MRSLDFTVELFRSAEEFLKSSRLQEVSCLVLDVQLPGMSGLQLQSHLAERGYRIPVNQIIQEVTILLRNEMTRNRVSLRTDLAADLPRVSGDPVQLQQVLINLVMNSIDAMRSLAHRPRELIIKSARNHNEVSIQVQDSGAGLDVERAEHIFEPFFTTKPEGIGMGLSISRSIVESHGGRLWAESDSKGAMFQFTLPTK